MARWGPWLLLGILGCGAVTGQPPAPATAPRKADKGPAAPLHGLAFSPYLDGQGPGSILTDAQITARLQLVRGKSRWIRTYASGGGLDRVPRLAKKLGFQVVGGAWITARQPPEEREEELARLAANVKQGHVDVAVIGNEVLLRKEMPPQDLAGLLRHFRGRIGGAVPVTTAEPAAQLLANGEVMASCDLILAHLHPYWHDLAPEAALAWVQREYRHLNGRAAGKKVIIGETGWPSAGGRRGRAVPTEENAARFFNDVVQWAAADKVPVFYFAAFDEAWKNGTDDGSSGGHWGIMDSKGTLKNGMARALAKGGGPAPAP
jgi:exo-beta-1,3-glucanase (GH17 family)